MSGAVAKKCHLGSEANGTSMYGSNPKTFTSITVLRMTSFTAIPTSRTISATYEPRHHFTNYRMARSHPGHVTIMDHPHLPNSPEEEEEYIKQESFIRNWENENKCFLDMNLPELNKLIEETKNDNTIKEETE